MNLNTSSFHFALEELLASEFHWARSRCGLPIKDCADRLKVSVEVIDKIERGRFNDPEVSLLLLAQYAALFKQRLVLKLGDSNGSSLYF